MCNASTGKNDPNLVAGGGAGIRGDGYSGVAIAKPALSFINGGTGGKIRYLTGALVGGHLRLGQGEEVVGTLVGEC